MKLHPIALIDFTLAFDPVQGKMGRRGWPRRAIFGAKLPLCGGDGLGLWLLPIMADVAESDVIE
jgi:hypothetical protein